MTPPPPEARPETLTEREVIERIVERGDLRVLGLPVDDVKDIYRLMAEWNRVGGRPGLLEDFREKERLLAELRELQEALQRIVALDDSIDAAVEIAERALAGDKQT